MNENDYTQYLMFAYFQVQKVKCKDPKWMRSINNNLGTFYPAATQCYRDPSQAGTTYFSLTRPPNWVSHRADMSVFVCVICR